MKFKTDVKDDSKRGSKNNLTKGAFGKIRNAGQKYQVRGRKAK